MPATMHRHAIQVFGAKKRATISPLLFPSRVVRERRDHSDRMAALQKKPTQRRVERTNADNLRRVVDSPNRDFEFHATTPQPLSRCVRLRPMLSRTSPLKLQFEDKQGYSGRRD